MELNQLEIKETKQIFKDVKQLLDKAKENPMDTITLKMYMRKGRYVGMQITVDSQR